MENDDDRDEGSVHTPHITTTAPPEVTSDVASIFEKHAAKPVTPFMTNKFINESAKNWDNFYKRNTVNAYKDRHWTFREFGELLEPATDDGSKTILLEIGCGVGNFIWPLLDQSKSHFIYACDFSKRAIEFVQKDPRYDETKCKAFVCDLTKDPLVDNIPAEGVDVVSSIFCLSAIPPEKLPAAVSNVASVLKKGGSVILRDYGILDQAELRFKPGHMIREHFYARQDGTFSVYFSLEQLTQLFQDAGLEVVESYYVRKDIVNRKRDLKMERVWVQGHFRKL